MMKTFIWVAGGIVVGAVIGLGIVHPVNAYRDFADLICKLTFVGVISLVGGWLAYGLCEVAG